MRNELLLIGAGDLGTEIGLRFAAGAGSGANVDASGDAAAGQSASVGARGVVALRRRGELVPAPLVGVSADIAHGLPDDLPAFDGDGSGPRFLVVCLTAGGRDESSYRATFLDGVKAVLDDVRGRAWVPERALFVSSTGVCAAEGDVSEETPPSPSSPTSAVLAEAEQAFLAGLPEATRGIVIRPSGLYGPGREWFIDKVRRGDVSDRERTTHRAHRDDVARAVVHLLTMPAQPEALYLVTDDAPVPAGEVADFIAQRLGVGGDDTASTGSTSGAAVSRRLRNGRLRATGFEFLYPTYREGYAAILDGVGTRHP